MDSKLEAHIDEIFQDVPKTDKMVTMINRIKSKANSKYLETREKGYSRSVAFNEVDDWLMKAKVIVDEEAGKLTPAEIAAAPKTAPAFVEEDKSNVISSTSTDDGQAAVVVEREQEASFPTYDYSAPSFTEEVPSETPVEETTPVEENSNEKGSKKKEKKVKEGKKSKKEEVEEDDIVIPVKSVGKVGKIIGAVLVVAGVALIIVASLLVVGVI